VRLRAKPPRSALVGKGLPSRPTGGAGQHRGARTTIVLIGGGRVGLVRRTRFGTQAKKRGPPALTDLPASAEKRVFSGDAGIATIEQFRPPRSARRWSARAQARTLRVPSPKRQARAGARRHGSVLHPGQTARGPSGGRRDDPHRRRAGRVRRGGTCTVARPADRYRWGARG